MTPADAGAAAGDTTPVQAPRPPGSEHHDGGAATPAHLTAASLFRGSSPATARVAGAALLVSWPAELAAPWQIFMAVKEAACQVEILAGHPGLVFDNEPAAAGTSAAAELLFQSARLVVLLEKVPDDYLVSGRIEESLYLCFEECTEIAAVLDAYVRAPVESVDAGVSRSKLLKIRSAQLASCTKLLAAHAAIDEKAIDGANECSVQGEADYGKDFLRPVKLNDACQWFWLKHFPSENIVMYKSVLAALQEDPDFGDLNSAGKRSLFDIAVPIVRGCSMPLMPVSGAAEVGTWITLHAMDLFAKTYGLASLTTIGSNTFVSIDTEFEITEIDIDPAGHVKGDSALNKLQTELSVRVDVRPASSLAELRRQLHQLAPTAVDHNTEYNFLCHGSAVRVADETEVHVCDVIRNATGQRNSVVLRAAVRQDQAQIPLTSLFERRMAYFIKPADDWRQLGMLVGEHVGVHVIKTTETPSTVFSVAGATPSAEPEDPAWVLDVVLVPGITHDVQSDARRRFFWEENGLVESIWADVCSKDLPIRILGVEHRAAGWEVSAWQNQSVGEHLVSAAGVLRRLLAAGVGNRPVIFIAETVGGLLVQQMLLLPCSSQSRDVPEDAVALCEATLAVVDFATPQIGLTESFRHAEKKLRRSLSVQAADILNEKLQAKVPYIASVQDQFSRSCATEHCLHGLVQVHVTNGPLDRPHERVGEWPYDQMMVLGDNEFTVSFPNRSADSISRPREDGHGSDEEDIEEQDQIMIALVTDVVTKAATVAGRALSMADVSDADPLVTSPPAGVRRSTSIAASPRTSMTQSQSSPVSRLRTHRTQTSTRVRNLMRSVSVTVFDADAVHHVSIVLRRRTLQALHGTAEHGTAEGNSRALAALPLISGAPMPYEFLFEGLHRLLNLIRKWAGMSWRRFVEALDGPDPSVVLHLHGEDRQTSLAQGWLRHTLNCKPDSNAIVRATKAAEAQPGAPDTETPKESTRCIYDLDTAFEPLHEMCAAVDRAARIVSDLRGEHAWWWDNRAAEAGIEIGSSYAHTLGLATLNSEESDLAGVGPADGGATADGDSSEDEQNAVLGSSFAKALRRPQPDGKMSSLTLESLSLVEPTRSKGLQPTTVVVLGRADVGKTTLIGLLVQDDLLDFAEVESTLTSMKLCGCTSFDEEELLVEYMSEDEVEDAVRELERAAQVLCAESGVSVLQRFSSRGPVNEPEQAIKLRAFASSLVNAHRELCQQFSVAGKSVRPVRKLPMPRRTSRTHALAPSQELKEIQERIKQYSYRDPESETSDASASDLICNVTLKLNIPALQHLALLDTPGRARAAGAEESHPREILRQISTQKALESADCWMYLMPWFQQDCLQQLEEDMQCWRSYILGAEGLVALTWFAEDEGLEDDANSEPEPEQVPWGEGETMADRLFGLREALRRSGWCPRGPQDHYAISPAVSGMHGVLEASMRDSPEDEWEELCPPDLQSEVEKVARRISGRLACEHVAGTHEPDRRLMHSLSKEHWPDAVREICGIATIAERLCAAASAFVAQRSVPEAIETQWQTLVETHLAVSKDVEGALQSLHACKRARSIRTHIREMQREIEAWEEKLEGDLAGTNTLLQSMYDANERVYNKIAIEEGDDEGSQAILAELMAEIGQEGKVVKPKRQFELYKQFDVQVGARAAKLVGLEIDPEDPKFIDCLPLPTELVRQLEEFSGQSVPAHLESLRAGIDPSGRSFADVARVVGFVAKTAVKKHRERKPFPELVGAAFEKQKALPKKDFGERFNSDCLARAEAIAYKGLVHLWVEFSAQLRSSVTDLEKKVGKCEELRVLEQQQTDEADRMEMLIRESNGALQQCTDAASCVRMDELELALQQKTVRLNVLCANLRACERELLVLNADCLNVDVRNRIRDRAHVLSEANAIISSQDGQSSEEPQTPRSRSNSGTEQPLGLNSGQAAAGQAVAVNRWSEFEIDFDELQIQRRVGAGGSGIVHKGSHRGQDVAVKVFKNQEELTDDELKEVSLYPRDHFTSACSLRSSRVALL